MIRKNVYSSHIMRIQNILIFTAYFKYFSKFRFYNLFQCKQSNLFNVEMEFTNFPPIWQIHLSLSASLLRFALSLSKLKLIQV